MRENFSTRKVTLVQQQIVTYPISVMVCAKNLEMKVKLCVDAEEKAKSF